MNPYMYVKTRARAVTATEGNTFIHVTIIRMPENQTSG